MRGADRVDRVAQPLVGCRRRRELALELVRGERARRLRARRRRGREARRRAEAALEPAPADAGGVELVADVRAGQRRRRRASSSRRSRAARRRSASCRRGRRATVSPFVSAPLIIWPTLPVLPETRFTAPGDDGPNVVPKELSLRRERLGVVPHRRDGVAVVVVHDVAGLARLAGALLPVAVPTVVTNLSICPPSNAFCSSL